MTSTARIEANRRNATKSTGPKTAEGKARSRLNALTHGLRAEQVVLPHENAEAFEAERAAFFDEWQPPTATRAALVERLVADVWRLRRCVRVEGARLRGIADRAAAEFDEAARAGIDEAARRLGDLPGWAVGQLEQSRRGVDLLRSSWEGLVEVLSIEGEWKDGNRHHCTLCRLMGMDPRTSPAELGDVAMASWALAITNDPALAERPPWDDPDGELTRPYPPARAEKVRGLLLDLATREARRLEALHDHLPDPGPLRDAYIDERCVDNSKEAIALQRYEGMHDRSFRSGLKLLVDLTRTGADLVDGSAPNEPNDQGLAEILSSVASEGGPRPEDTGGQATRATPTREAAAPNEPNDRAPGDDPAPNGPNDRGPEGDPAPNEPNEVVAATARPAPEPPIVPQIQPDRVVPASIYAGPMLVLGPDGPMSLPSYR